MINLLPDIILIVAICGLSCAALLYAARLLPKDEAALVTAVNQLLPQTQCAQCGFPGCRPYAEAIAAGEPINRCPPGGEQTIVNLAALLGTDVIAMDATCGETIPTQIAVIDEQACIGCTLCIPACPVEAIIGAPQQMHSILESACTGCDLCVEPCPVDCITMEIIQTLSPLPFPSVAHACIGCGWCVPACPKDLHPEQLFWYREDHSKLEQLSLDSCIECGLCDAACPSEIPLTRTFAAAKSQINLADAEVANARRAEVRFELKQSRSVELHARVANRPTNTDKDQLLASLREQP